MIDDPEVLADLRLRAASERDPSRSRRDPTAGWTPTAIVGRLPCRSGASCSGTVEITDEVLHAIRTSNTRLRALGQADLLASQIAFCDACRSRGQALQADRNRRAVDALAMLIRELKSCSSPQRERELVAAIRAANHPDVDGLIAAIAQRRQGPAGRSREL